MDKKHKTRKEVKKMAADAMIMLGYLLMCGLAVIGLIWAIMN